MVVGHDLRIAFASAIDIRWKLFRLSPFAVGRALGHIDAKTVFLILFVVFVLTVNPYEVQRVAVCGDGRKSLVFVVGVYRCACAPGFTPFGS